MCKLFCLFSGSSCIYDALCIWCISRVRRLVTKSIFCDKSSTLQNLSIALTFLWKKDTLAPVCLSQELKQSVSFYSVFISLSDIQSVLINIAMLSFNYKLESLYTKVILHVLRLFSNNMQAPLQRQSKITFPNIN